ncbi:unnamed protein product [Arctia plantaginis]|uniref:Uncharacterized protein n=1 Tax=Arctia plantaginis TaxID=874455 RepID=A0A8S1AR22_ARCPL|nr:unnamed protein product [Arctia plantaginis]CAB3249024.1 unnamed protein product [Arctia plantaginis]
MSLKEPPEKSAPQPRLEDSLEDVVLSHSKDGLVVNSKTSIQLPILPPVVIDQKKHGGTRPIPSAEHLPPEHIQSDMSSEEFSSSPSSQPSFIETLLSFIQHGFVFWRRVFSDSFRWQIFKSLLLFAAGLKISKEYYKHANAIETPPSNVNDRKAWLERCKKHKERKGVIGNSTAK